MITLKPWAYGPFELIFHAETHRRNGDDFDRRIALIGFDNAIEVAITTYLSLHPIQRGNRHYQKTDVDKWLDNYHTKIDFFLSEVQQRILSIECGKDEIVWFHSIRNGQYHGGDANVPPERALQVIRKTAIWVFSVLYDVPVADIEQLIEQWIAEKVHQNIPQRNEHCDRLIDNHHGMILIGEQLYYASEVIYAIDPVNYIEVARGLEQPEPLDTSDAGQ
jgi:hypothetical protein